MKKISFLARTSLIIAFFLSIKSRFFVRVEFISRRYANLVQLRWILSTPRTTCRMCCLLSFGGALAMAFIPLMSEYLTTKRRNARLPGIYSRALQTWPLWSQAVRRGIGNLQKS